MTSYKKNPWNSSVNGIIQEAALPGGGERFFDSQILNVKEAANFLGLSTKTVYKYARVGLLPHQRIGNKYIFLRSELIRFLKGD